MMQRWLDKYQKFAQAYVSSFAGRYHATPDRQRLEEFYLAFENRFRGSEATIKDRLDQRYGGFLDQAKSSIQGPLFVDVGCGRGEFLEVARNKGYRVVGGEISGVNVSKNRASGFEVQQNDAVGML